MTLTIIRSPILLTLGAALSLVLPACSSDKTSSTGSDGGAANGTGGATNGSGGANASSGGAGTGGSNASGGASGAASGGKGGAAGGADQYVCDKAPPRDPGGTSKEGATCCETSLGFKAGTCMKASSVTDPLRKAAYGHDTCTRSTDAASDLKCVPTDSALADAGALGVYDTCKASFGGSLALEGRCLPKCFVAGMAAAANLAQETCAAKDLVCAPCYNPIDGTDTGACSQAAGDSPKEAKPATFKKCGALKAGDPDTGICVPEALVTDPVQQKALKDAFAGMSGVVNLCDAGQLCAPTLKAMDLSACFKHCNSIVGPGACVPAYLVPSDQRSALESTPDVCDKATEMCAPCLNPLSMPPNQPTGACN
jgi:hypothetical protein